MNEPQKIHNIGDVVDTPIGELPVLDITPILIGDQIMNWLYWFGDEADEKFTTEELG